MNTPIKILLCRIFSNKLQGRFIVNVPRSMYKIYHVLLKEWRLSL